MSELRYDEPIEKAIKQIIEQLIRDQALRKFNPRWLAIKLLEGDEEVRDRIRESIISDKILKLVEELREEISKIYGSEASLILIDQRYRIIDRIVRRVVRGRKRITLSDLIDKVVLDKYLGIPIFITILWIIFQFTMMVSTPLCDLLGDVFNMISLSLSDLTGHPIIDELLFGAYGVVNGVGTVLSFVPIIFFLYFALSILEDSGYMARAAFITNNLMRKVGLTGRSIISMILGFGCNVPAIYSARAIHDEKDRIITILINPLMLCSARLVVFSLIAYAFFKTMAGDVILSLYIIGIMLALLLAKFFRKAMFKGYVSPFLLELPEYQKPSIKTVLSLSYRRGIMFFTKAGKVILPGLIIMAILGHLKWPSLSWISGVEDSILAIIGKSITPLLYPLGWDWRLAVAAIFGFIAKEIVIGAMALLYGVPEEGLAGRLVKLYTPVQAYAYMIFILIYTPCIVTIAAIKHETSSWRWPIFTVVYEVILAYAAALLVTILGTLIWPGGV